MFEKPSVMKAAEYASVIGSVMPIADRPVPEELAELLGWQEPPVLELIAEHLSQVSAGTITRCPAYRECPFTMTK